MASVHQKQPFPKVIFSVFMGVDFAFLVSDALFCSFCCAQAVIKIDEDKRSWMNIFMLTIDW
jgi:hypothetical protein